MYSLVKPFLFQCDPEHIHELTIKTLAKTQRTPLEALYRRRPVSNPTKVMGLTFSNPVGLSAGLDKNGECIDAFAAMGFGFVEVGTVTPRPQDGNPKPRLFRVQPAEGIINRMGFNNKGIDYLIENVKQARYNGILGINIGKNKDTPIEHGKDDYLICMEKSYEHASYITVNISSPNTPDLRSLQYGDALDDLLGSLKEKQAELAQKHHKQVPLVVKIAPDLDEAEIEQIADSLVRFNIDGVIATNTTLDRELVFELPHAHEAGGLSGRPVQNKSTQVIAELSRRLNGKLPIIGVGGIDSLTAAREKMAAGASLVQVYSGFIYQGPALVQNLARYL
ncbi:quinone-dependent dihydroorotate dehydrogenase [Oceanimonas baumannii]|uniref:Dihydroorotate dehydrogenase (quinone) n=1 Tax=Oceanimonas baumannii TaxID=129578 RepID=A0A235CBP4_9GAMM|nr:quinone-dependent dihydroorotate dehydrogenase [Oceanimonas baumannii]OYD21225.1 dihydroorotate dehydrogenase (quinone) [Oceanimonas baumannii]TDW55274.1 dihydroorotate oxidase A [Oceanimonas baumannii]